MTWKFRVGVCLFWLLASSARLLGGYKFSSVTEEVNLRNVSGQIAAFADFNSDKATDVLVLNVTGRSLASNWRVGEQAFEERSPS